MGLFDIFKKNGPEKGSKQEIKTEPATVQLPEGYEDSLEKTEHIARLLAVPFAERDKKWVDEFLTDLPKASFSCGNPQVIAGPDGFPYFQLFVPEPGAEFQSFVIDKMVDDFLLERGFGVVINPGAEHTDCVLTYGDILDLHLNGRLFTIQNSISSITTPEILTETEEVMIGQPSETILPVQTRKLLRDFFELNGISSPKLLMVMRGTENGISQDLAFNITPDQFETEEHYKNMMQTVTWYLPRHYSIIRLKDGDFENSFLPL